MPRYFFHVHDGYSAPDAEGTKLANLTAARVEAVRLCGEILRDSAAAFWESEAWRMDVCDEAGCKLFTLHVSATEERRRPELVSG